MFWNNSKCQDVEKTECEGCVGFQYPKCRPGYWAPLCVKCSRNCPTGMTDIGISCSKIETIYNRKGTELSDCSGKKGRKRRRGEKTKEHPKDVKPLTDLMGKSEKEQTDLKVKQSKDAKAFMDKQKAAMDKFVKEQAAKNKADEEAHKKKG